MNFSQLLKKYSKNLKAIKKVKIPINEIHCQYNPDRFKKYKTVITDPNLSILGISNSPHVNFLKQYESGKNFKQLKSSNYYKMHKLYGKGNSWITKKIKKFMSLYEFMKSNKMKDRPTILEYPIIENQYNDTYEIYEGHHRIACYYCIGNQNIPVIILKGKFYD